MQHYTPSDPVSAMLREAGYNTAYGRDTMTAINLWLHDKLGCFVELSLAPNNYWAVHTAMRVANGEVRHFSEYNSNGYNFPTADAAFDHGVEMLLFHYLHGKWPSDSDIIKTYGRILR